MPKRIGSSLSTGILNSSTFPAGAITPHSGLESSIPDGWILAAGGTLSRTEYPVLFRYYEALGFPYGLGDGSTTFGIPDLRGRTIHGVNVMGGINGNRITASGCGINGDTLGASGGTETVTLDSTMIPPHNHTATGSVNSGTTNHSHAGTPSYGTQRTSNGGGGGTVTGCWTTLSTGGMAGSGGSHTHSISADWGPPAGAIGSANAHNNMPPSLVMLWLIKT